MKQINNSIGNKNLIQKYATKDSCEPNSYASIYYHMTASEYKLVCLSIPFLNSYYSSILQCPLKRQ